MNNYFDSLTGSEARSALCMMNGVTGAAPAYVQVQRAQVICNTFVNCSHNLLFGRSDGGGTLGPIDCTNANNIVRGFAGQLVEVQTVPTNFLWEGNVFFGATACVTNSGIITTDLLLVRNGDGLWRPATNSPVLGAAVGNYSAAIRDLDGQSRSATKDVGCDQSSTDLILRKPRVPADVGPTWMRSVAPIKTIAFNSNSVAFTWGSLPALMYQIQLISWTGLQSVR